MNLNTKAWLGLIFLTIAMGLLLFGPAASFAYWQAWAFLAVFFGASLLHTLYLMKHDPELLKRRMSGGPTAEKETTQRIIMLFASIGFVALLVAPALDHRFGWSAIPVILVIAGDLLIAAGYYVIFLVFKENTFTSAAIEIAEGHKVISTGPYALVRHPMYAGAYLHWALCAGAPPDVRRRISLLFWNPARARLLLGIPAVLSHDSSSYMASPG